MNQRGTENAYAVALTSPERQLTRAQCEDAVARCAKGLHASGLVSGDRLAIVLPNSIDTIILLLASLRAGIVACPLSTRLPTDGRNELMRTLDAKAVVLPEFETVPELEVLALTDVLSTAAETQGSDTDADASLAALYVMTSGSSGAPKAAALSPANLLANARASNRNIPVGSSDGWLLSLPLFHVSGLGILFRCLDARTTVHVPGADESVEQSLERPGLTHISLVATQLRQLMDDPASASRLKKFKAILLGGSGIPEALLREACAMRLPVVTSYGLTETASQATSTRPGAPLEDLTSSGTPLISGSLKISEEGELLVRGETLFQGYFREGKVVAQTDKDGWFHTGDQGHLDATGRLHVTGRMDNQFISGGENIQPEVIEAVLQGMSGIRRALVVPVQDDRYGHRPVAFLQAGEPRPTDEYMETELRKQLPGFMIPDDFHPWPENLPQTEMKVAREPFRKLAEDLRRDRRRDQS